MVRRFPSTSFLRSSTPTMTAGRDREDSRAPVAELQGGPRVRFGEKNLPGKILMVRPSKAKQAATSIGESRETGSWDAGQHRDQRDREQGRHRSALGYPSSAALRSLLRAPGLLLPLSSRPYADQRSTALSRRRSSLRLPRRTPAPSSHLSSS
jgi:hypothetical protein